MSDVTSDVGVQAPSRAVLLDFLDKHRLLSTLKVDYCLIVTLPCGETRQWRMLEDIPHESVPCECGRAPHPHWFIRYVDEPQAGA